VALAGQLDHVLRRDFANARGLDAYHSRYREVMKTIGQQAQPEIIEDRE
jgi:hypothetical protein